jgi:YD repeat-containing protein
VRTHNSARLYQPSLFGSSGWTSTLDESIQPYGDSLLRLNLPSGRGVYFTKTSMAFVPLAPAPGPDATIVAVNDGTYRLRYRNGETHSFLANGKISKITDRNLNDTVFAYDPNGLPTSVTEPGGCQMAITTESHGFVSSISDAAGVIATYTYNTTLLSGVRYADSSGFSFDYSVLNGTHYGIWQVTDALGNVVERHRYDDAGRGISSERGTGINLYNLRYPSPAETDVTDGLGRVSKYFFDLASPPGGGALEIGRNRVTRIEGALACSTGCGGGGP